MGLRSWLTGYSYLSCIPWALLAGGGVARLWARGGESTRRATTIVAVGVLALLVVLTRAQTRVWRDSRTLWTAAIERGGSSGLAHANLASILNANGEFEAACDHSRQAIAVLPGNRTAHHALGVCSMELGDLSTAERHLEFARDIAETVGRSRTGTSLVLAIVKTRLGKLDEAEQVYRAMVRAEPESPRAHFNLGSFLASRDKRTEARVCLERAVELEPAFADSVVSPGRAARGRAGLCGGDRNA